MRALDAVQPADLVNMEYLFFRTHKMWVNSEWSCGKIAIVKNTILSMIKNKGN